MLNILSQPTISYSKLHFELESADYEIEIFSDYGFQIVKTTIIKSDVVKVAIPKSGAFGSNVGGVLCLTGV